MSFPSKEEGYRPPLKIYGPEFLIHPQDPSQPQRRVRVQEIFQDKTFFVKAVDSPHLEPRDFFVRDCIDLKTLFSLLATSWSMNRPIPFPLKPLKRIPVEVLEQFPRMSGAEMWNLFVELSQRGFFTKLKSLSRGNQPKHIRWADVPSLCLKTRKDSP